MALRLVSLVLVLPVFLVNVYWASGLESGVANIAASSDGRCSMVGWLWPLGTVLPWVFLLCGGGAAFQLIFRGSFGLFTALLKLHVVHLALLITLLVVGSTFCAGATFWPTMRILSGLLGFGLVVMLLPVPILALQMEATRKVDLRKGSAL